MNINDIMAIIEAWGTSRESDGITDCYESEETIDKHRAVKVAIAALVQERDALKTLVVNVHHAKGRYHSQLAMAALYEACGLPNVKPVSGGKS